MRLDRMVVAQVLSLNELEVFDLTRIKWKLHLKVQSKRSFKSQNVISYKNVNPKTLNLTFDHKHLISIINILWL